jgi:hypothetical protein
MMHLLDANVFMEAHRLYYPIEVAPTFWSWLASAHLVGEIGSVERVRKEILDGEPKSENARSDPLVEWVKGTPKEFWVKPSDDVPDALKRLATWAYDPVRQYKQAAVAEFMASADLHLIAQAIADDCVVVTREQAAPESRRRIKIPDVCDAFSVKWMDPFRLYRELGLQL